MACFVPASPASTASILSDGEIVPSRKRKRAISIASLASTASLDLDEEIAQYEPIVPPTAASTTTNPDEPENQAIVEKSMIRAKPEQTDKQDVAWNWPTSDASTPNVADALGDDASTRVEPVNTVQDSPILNAKIDTKQVQSRSQAFGDRPEPGESAEHFVRRLPPSTTSCEEVLDWIWAYHPEDGKNGPDSDLAGFMSVASTLLQSFNTFKSKTERSNDKSRLKQAKIKKQRDELPDSIKAIATAYGITSGKWMLFPPTHDVDQVWLKVVEGTISGKLGTGVKVAPAGTSNGYGQLICVYTKDFADQDDVCRVLLELRKRGLVDSPIYYKADAWTYLGIESKNQYGLKASLYSSKDMLQKYHEKLGRA